MLSVNAPAVYNASWRGLSAQYVIDGRALVIREPQKQTELLWQLVRGISLVHSGTRYGVHHFIYIAYADRPQPEPRLVPLRIDPGDPQTQALIAHLRQMPQWRGEGSALAMRSALGISNRPVYLIVGVILGVILVFTAITMGIVLILVSSSR